MTNPQPDSGQKLLRCNACGYIGGEDNFFTTGAVNEILVCPDCTGLNILDWAGKRDVTIPVELLFYLLGLAEKSSRYDARHKKKTGSKAPGWNSEEILAQLYKFMESEGFLPLSSEGEE